MRETLDLTRTRGMQGTFRFDLPGVGSWHVTVADGERTVREGNQGAACVIETDEETLLRISRGEQNPTTAFLTGSLRIQGDLALAARLDRFRA